MSENTNKIGERSLTRRAFLKSGTGAVLAVVAAGGVGGLLASCTTKTPTTSATTPPSTTPPAVQTPVSTTQGPVTDVNAQQGTVTIETPTGPEVVKVSPTTQITLNGTVCTIDQLDDTLAAAGGPFDCTVVTDDAGNVLSVEVVQVPVPASIRGTISDVNINDSTVTVKTGSGDKIFDVDPETGLLIGGVACSLDLVNALVDAGGQLPCTVIYSTDTQGNTLYIDIANPPNLTQGTGTITSVDIQKSTVTLQTDKGPRTFEVDAKTGAFLNGEVCSLQDVQTAMDQGDTFGSCEVIYYTNDAGDLTYIDVSHQLNP